MQNKQASKATIFSEIKPKQKKIVEMIYGK